MFQKDCCYSISWPCQKRIFLCIPKIKKQICDGRESGIPDPAEEGLIKWTQVIINSNLPFSGGPHSVSSCLSARSSSREAILKNILFHCDREMFWFSTSLTSCRDLQMSPLNSSPASSAINPGSCTWQVVPCRASLKSCGNFQRLKVQKT